MNGIDICELWEVNDAGTLERTEFAISHPPVSPPEWNTALHSFISYFSSSVYQFLNIRTVFSLASILFCVLEIA